MLYHEALAIRRKRLGNEDLRIADELRSLVIAVLQQNRPAEAEPLEREVLAMRSKLLGPEHEDVADSIYTLALVLAAQGKSAEAETTFRAALSVLRKISAKAPSQENSTLAMALHHLADVLRSQK